MIRENANLAILNIINRSPSAVSEELLEDSIKFICVQMADEVSQCGKLQRLELSFDFGAETVKNWIARFVDYVIKSDYVRNNIWRNISNAFSAIIWQGQEHICY